MAEGDKRIADLNLEKWLSSQTEREEKAFPKLPLEQPALLSHGQERIWLIDKIFPETPLYHYAHVYYISGDFDFPLFLKCCERLTERHVIMKTIFQETNGEARQHIKPDLKIESYYHDLTGVPFERREGESSLLRKHYSESPFNLSNGPLWRIACLQKQAQQFELIFVIHHILGDRWSLGIIHSDLVKYYRAFKSDQNPAIEATTPYRDYANWQRQQPLDEGLIAYWKDKLKGPLPVLNWMKNRQRNSQSIEGHTCRKVLNKDLSSAIKSASIHHGTTPFVLLLAAYKILIFRHTGDDDLLVGSPISNRNKIELEKLVGFFNETVVFRSLLNPNQSFRSLIHALKVTVQEAVSHSDMPFEVLARIINPTRDPGVNPIFQTMFLYNTEEKLESFDPSLIMEDQMIQIDVAKFPLTFMINERDGELEMSFEYRTAMFDQEFVHALLQHFECLVQQIISHPDEKIGKLKILPEEERSKIIELWNRTKKPLSSHQSVVELFSKIQQENSDSAAVKYEGETLRYFELDRWTTQIAERLIRQGLQSGDIIGVYANRSLEMIVGIWSVLKAGGAYLPLDPGYPDDRIQFMIEDAQVKMILCQPGLAFSLNGTTLIIDPIEKAQFDSGNSELFHLPLPEINDPAYVIYTSGSSGKPKGVLISHGNLLHSTTARDDFYNGPVGNFLLLSSFSFDSSIVGIFWTICTGGTLILPPKRIEQDPSRLGQLIEENQVSHTLLLPSLYHILLSSAPASRYRSLKTVILAGEALYGSLVELHYRLLPSSRLYNEYGPTEATVWCIAHAVLPHEVQEVPIGKPITNAQAYVLDEFMEPVPIGTAGELYIGGLGVAKGYLNRPELTLEKFVRNPFDALTDGLLYRTGDLVRYQNDGVIEFLGRMDNQVKIRGHRIELDEIKNMLLQQTEVRDAVVIIKEKSASAEAPGQKQIFAFIESPNEKIDQQLRKILAIQLPGYMQPSQIVIAHQLPRLPNGKVDLQRLEVPTQSNENRPDQQSAPISDTAYLLVQIWEEVLQLRGIRISDNFFDLGGDSISSIRILVKAREAGLSLRPTDIFEYQTIEQLAENAVVSKKIDLVVREPESEDYPVPAPLSEMQKAFYFHQQVSEDDQGFLQLEFDLEGPVDPDLFFESWNRVADYHESLRTSFHWPETDDPYREVSKKVEFQKHVAEWDLISESERNAKWQELLAEDRKIPLDLSRAPISRIYLAVIGVSKCKILWSCHHALLDGWSAGLILKDVLKILNFLSKGEKISINPSPSFSEYLAWKNSHSRSEARHFWREHFKDSIPSLLGDISPAKSLEPQTFHDLQMSLSRADGDKIREKAARLKLTLNTVFQGFWLISLASVYKKNDLTTGVTLSGRSSEFPKSEFVTGLLMNILPLHTSFHRDAQLIPWFQDLQKTNAEIRAFEHLDSSEIKDLIDYKGRELFDTIYVFGNFMAEQIEIGAITIKKFTGGFSSNYPLSIRINPIQEIEMIIRFRPDAIEQSAAEKLIKTLSQLLHGFIVDEFEENLFSELLPDRRPDESKSPINLKPNYKESQYNSPANATELQLIRIWESVLKDQFIGVDDDFFQLGASSLQAIQVLGMIHDQLAIPVSPKMFIKNPTIRRFAQAMGQSGILTESTSIIPMKTSGSRAPLFCIHSGGAHVFFYAGIAQYIDPELPVYAIQPKGIDGVNPFHDSIGNMAADYIREIRLVQPHGPYTLLGTCFSNAVVMEMAHQLEANGESVATIFIIDSAPAHTTPPPQGKKYTLLRFLNMLGQGDFKAIQKKIRNKVSARSKKRRLKQAPKSVIRQEAIVSNLNDLYAGYEWKAYHGRVVLIRSSEFQKRRDKQFHVDQWQKLAPTHLEIKAVPGKHLTLFDEPEVRGLSALISESLS